MVKVEYENADEREQLINEHISSGLFLFEEQNITEGNFLIFVAQLEMDKLNKPAPPTEEERIQALEETTNFLLGL